MQTLYLISNVPCSTNGCVNQALNGLIHTSQGETVAYPICNACLDGQPLLRKLYDEAAESEQK